MKASKLLRVAAIAAAALAAPVCAQEMPPNHFYAGASAAMGSSLSAVISPLSVTSIKEKGGRSRPFRDAQCCYWKR